MSMFRPLAALCRGVILGAAAMVALFATIVWMSVSEAGCREPVCDPPPGWRDPLLVGGLIVAGVTVLVCFVRWLDRARYNIEAFGGVRPRWGSGPVGTLLGALLSGPALAQVARASRTVRPGRTAALAWSAWLAIVAAVLFSPYLWPLLFPPGPPEYSMSEVEHGTVSTQVAVAVAVAAAPGPFSADAVLDHGVSPLLLAGAAVGLAVVVRRVTAAQRAWLAGPGPGEPGHPGFNPTPPEQS